MTLDVGNSCVDSSFHILPKGLMRIRHYGLLANRSNEPLGTLRQPSGLRSPDPDRSQPETWQDLVQRLTGQT